MKELCLVDLSTSLLPHLLPARRIILVVGAGISTSSGIPDFRGAQGLYTQNKNAAQDLFDATVAFQTPESTQRFYRFISRLSNDIEGARPTKTHHVMKELEDAGKLLRVYSQNIDHLEVRAGLTAGFDKAAGCRVVQLHGSLDKAACTVCQHKQPLDAAVRQDYAEGVIPPCPKCEEEAERREKAGKRVGRRAGVMRPDIVLYNETHPRGVEIAEIVAGDIRKRPDLLLIMGTSLKVPGCKRLIRDIADEVHERGGLVVFVNSTKVAASEWEGVIDYHVLEKSDDFCEVLSVELAKQEAKKEERRKKKEAQIDKENAVEVAKQKTPWRLPNKSVSPDTEKEIVEALTALKPFAQEGPPKTVQAGPYALRSRTKATSGSS